LPPLKHPDRTRVFFIRHCQVAEQWHGKLYGGLDVELSEVGLEHSRAIGKALSNVEIDAIVSSDLSRAAFLADRIAEPHGIEVERNAAFRERNFGELSGISWKDFQVKHPKRFEEFESFRYGCPCEDGETFYQLGDRVYPALDEYVRRHAGQTVAVVAHAGVLRVILQKAMGLPPEKIFDFQLRFGAICMIEYQQAAECGSEKPYTMIVNASPEDAVDLDLKTRLETV